MKYFFNENFYEFVKLQKVIFLNQKVAVNLAAYFSYHRWGCPGSMDQTSYSQEIFPARITRKTSTVDAIATGGHAKRGKHLIQKVNIKRSSGKPGNITKKS